MEQPRSSGDELTELVELARKAPDRLAERLAPLPLRAQAALALSLAPKERLALLLHAPKPLKLVRSLPESEVYMTVRELGPVDALPIVALASADQLHHLVDLESWRRDRFDADRAGAWVALLLEAGEPALRRFLRSADDDELTLLARCWLRVTLIEPEGHGHEIHILEQTETGHEKGFVSPDGAYLVSPSIPEHQAAVRRILQIWYREQPDRYRSLLWAAVNELPSELEERALRWRQSRLEERGFPPWDEAISVYAPPARPGPRPVDGPALSEDEGPPRALLRLLPGSDPLSRAVDSLPDDLQQRVLREMVAVANRLLVADGEDFGEPAAHLRALRDAAGYVVVALDGRQATEPSAVREVVSETPMAELFREGYARAVELQNRARALTRDGWAAAGPRALELLEPADADEIRGMLAARPVHRDPAGAARPFRTLEEIAAGRAVLETAELIGRLMADRLGLDVAQVVRECDAAGSEPPRFSAFMLTLLAWHAARSQLRGDALPPDVATDFLREVASRRTAPVDAPARAMDSLVGRMVGAFELSKREAALLRDFGDACVARLAEECAALDPGVRIDPRFVTCLLLKIEEP
jgi:hypothetical protein